MFELLPRSKICGPGCRIGDEAALGEEFLVAENLRRVIRLHATLASQHRQSRKRAQPQRNSSSTTLRRSLAGERNAMGGRMNSRGVHASEVLAEAMNSHEKAQDAPDGTA